MRKLISILSICFLAVYPTISQKVNDSPLHAQILFEEAKKQNRDGNYKEALRLCKKGLKVTENTEFKNDTVKLRLSGLAGRVFYNVRQLDSAIYYGSKTIVLSKKIYGEVSKDMGISHNNLGTYFETIGRFDKALGHYNRALDIYKAIPDIDSSLIGYVYNNFGICYNVMGDHIRAISNYKKCLDIELNIFDENSLEVASTYNNIAYSYLRDAENYNQSLKYFKKVLKIRQNKLPYNHPYIANILHGLSVYYLKVGLNSKAKEHLKNALQIRLKKLGPDHPRVSQIYTLLGNCYLDEGDYPRAMIHLKKSEEILSKQVANNKQKLIRLYGLKARAYKEQESYDEAINTFALAFEVLKYKNWEKTPFEKIQFPFLLLQTLDQAAATHFHIYQHTADEAALRQAHQYYHTAIELIQFIKTGYREKESKQFLQEDKFHIYERAIACNHILYELTDSIEYVKSAFEVSERSKAQLLREALRSTQAIAFAGMPDSLIEQEKELRVSLAFWEEEQYRLQQKESEDAKAHVSEIGNRIFVLKNQYHELLSNFEQNYPAYYDMKYNDAVLSADKAIDQYTAVGKAVVSFFVGDSSLYRFVLQPSGIRIDVIANVGEIEHAVQALRGAILAYPAQLLNGEAFIDSFPDLAFTLYSQLFQELDLAGISDLLIVPDGWLWYVPFECLMQRPAAPSQDYRTYDYLLRQSAISYTYALSMLDDRNRRNQAHGYALLALAPAFDGQPGLIADRSTTFSKLDFNEAEVDKISQLLSGHKMVGNVAKLNEFAALAPKARLLHLATHAEANDESGDYSYLAFSPSQAGEVPELLYVKDVYNLNLNADMVVLSACETGLGELQRGEGLIGLGRAFSYAGAASIVTTLWKINDATTASLMEYFYSNIRAGERKDIALQQAKLSFISQQANRAAHPYYWAAFVPLGNMDALDFDNNFLSTIFLIGGVVFVVLFLIWILNKRKSTPSTTYPQGINV